MNTLSKEDSEKSLLRRIQRTAEDHTYKSLQAAGLELAASLPVGDDNVIPFGIIPSGQFRTAYTMKVWSSIANENILLNVKVTYPDGAIQLKEKKVLVMDMIPLTLIDDAVFDIQNHIEKHIGRTGSCS